MILWVKLKFLPCASVVQFEATVSTFSDCCCLSTIFETIGYFFAMMTVKFPHQSSKTTTTTQRNLCVIFTKMPKMTKNTDPKKPIKTKKKTNLQNTVSVQMLVRNKEIRSEKLLVYVKGVVEVVLL